MPDDVVAAVGGVGRRAVGGRGGARPAAGPDPPVRARRRGHPGGARAGWTASGSAGSTPASPTLEDAYVELVSRRVRQLLRQQARLLLAPAQGAARTSRVRGLPGGAVPADVRHRGAARLPASTATRRPCSTPGSGAAIMGMWTSQGVVAASLLTRERWAGTLELLVAAPDPAVAGSWCRSRWRCRRSASTAWSPRSCGMRWVFDLAARRSRAGRCSSSASLMAAVTLALVGFFLVGHGGAVPHLLGARRRPRVPRLAAVRLPGPGRPAARLDPAAVVGDPDHLGDGRRCASAADGGSPWGDLASAWPSERRTPCWPPASAGAWSTPPAATRPWPLTVRGRR